MYVIFYIFCFTCFVQLGESPLTGKEIPSGSGQEVILDQPLTGILSCISVNMLLPLSYRS